MDITNNKYYENLKLRMQENENFFTFLLSEVPDSGWKIHISCIYKNYNLIYKIVSEYCYEKKVSFKVVKNINLYFSNGFKNGDRSSYGKFITIYPKSEEVFINCIEELYNLLRNFEGPYILSDKRFKDCKCLYYRYGNNRLIGRFDEKGNGVRVINYSGYEYVDTATGYYNVPDFIKDPFYSEDEISTSDYLLVNYDITDGIKFSPVGGVYKAIHKESQNIFIVKEFYPHTAIMNENSDSFKLFTSEVSNLKKLSNFSFLPKYIEDFKDWDNYYLVEEYIHGLNLEEYSAENNTLVLGLNQESNRKYILNILKVFLKIIDNITELYCSGYILSDLSPDNIIINAEGVYFIDLESVSHINDSEDKIYSYTLNFFDKNISIEENIKLTITNLILFCFNKKSTLFNKFKPEEILSPIIRRVPDVSSILQLIENINSTETKVKDIKKYVVNAIEILNKKPRTTNKINGIQANNTTKKISREDLENILVGKDYIFNYLENKNSIAYGTLGNILAQKYILNKTFFRTEFEKYILDYRSNSFFYGHSGLLYLLNLNDIQCSDILTKITRNINYKDYNLSTGLSGIGISLLYHYLKNKDTVSKRNLRKILEVLNKSNFSELDNSLETGKLGIALFYIYYDYVFPNEEVLDNAIRILNDIISDMEKSSYRKSLVDNQNSQHFEYYISNGICGLITVLVEFTKKSKLNIFVDKIDTFVQMTYNIYSISPSYFTGNAGFLFTFFQVFNNIELKNEIRSEVKSQMEKFYLDILNTYKDELFYDANPENHEKTFLGGKEGILCILNIVNEQLTEKNMFPFIL